MRRSLLLAANLFLLGRATRLHAAEVCPFLNAATAAGFLHVTGASVTVTPSDKEGSKDDVTCDFTPVPNGPSNLLHVEVKTMTHPKQDFPLFLQQCGSHAEPVRGIGNEAITCSGKTKDGKRYDLILSRVRERSLLVRVSTADEKTEASTVHEESMAAADEVSGNLF